MRIQIPKITSGTNGKSLQGTGRRPLYKRGVLHIMYEKFKKYFLYYDLCAEAREALDSAARKICADQARLNAALEIKERLCSEDYNFTSHENQFKDNSAAFAAFVFTLMIEYTEYLYVRRGYPRSILIDTLKDMTIWINRHHDWFGEWGLSETGWLFGHMKGRLFRLGRLQFNLAECNDVTVYKNTSGEQVLFPFDGSEFNCKGFPRHEDEDLFIKAEISETDRTIKSNVVYEDGYAVAKDIILDKSEWECALKPGGCYLATHIPRDGRLDENECKKSFKYALEFFGKHFPDKKVRAIGCHTWLFDPNFVNLLKEDDNILKFQRMYKRFPTGSENYTGLSYIFVNIQKENIALAPTDTSFRRAIKEHLMSGGEMRCAGGYIIV